jgi:hypothetical protein
MCPKYRIGARAIAALAVVCIACSPRADSRVPPALLATLTACPYGVTEAVSSLYTPECVLGLFGHSITLPNPGADYSPGAFQINTPAKPRQLEVNYFVQSYDPAARLQLNINPVGRGRARPFIDKVSVSGVDVLLGAADQTDRLRYYWELNGWWYTLETPNREPSQRAFALSLIAGMLKGASDLSTPTQFQRSTAALDPTRENRVTAAR